MRFSCSKERVLNSIIYSRRLQREKMVVNVWPPSPKESARDLYVSHPVYIVMPLNLLLDLQNVTNQTKVPRDAVVQTVVTLLTRKKRDCAEKEKNGRERVELGRRRKGMRRSTRSVLAVGTVTNTATVLAIIVQRGMRRNGPEAELPLKISAAVVRKAQVGVLNP